MTNVAFAGAGAGAGGGASLAASVVGGVASTFVTNRGFDVAEGHMLPNLVFAVAGYLIRRECHYRS